MAGAGPSSHPGLVRRRRRRHRTHPASLWADELQRPAAHQLGTGTQGQSLLSELLLQDPLTQRIIYAEGVFVGYRGYERNQVRPLFPFGFGLSYTTFRYSHIEVRPIRQCSGRGTAFRCFLRGYQHRQACRRRCRAGLRQRRHASGPVERPAKELRGFARCISDPGSSAESTWIDASVLCLLDVHPGRGTPTRAAIGFSWAAPQPRSC